MRGRSAFYFGLRTLNSAATVASGFLITFLLVRRLGVDEYARFVLATAVGVYLSATDAGISRIIYAKLRAAFIAGRADDEAEGVAGGLVVYAAVTLAAVLAFAAALGLSGQWGRSGLTAQTLYFVFTALNLPWMLIRYLCWAVERHLELDALDVARRFLQIGVLFLALTPVDLRVVFLLLDLIWAAAIAAALALVASVIDLRAPLRHAWTAVKAFGRRYAGDAKPSLTFSLLEFAIYNFPYLFIPAVYGPGAPLVAFDLFYKFFRTGVTANSIASTAFLPRQTRAYHADDVAGVVRWTGLVLAASVAMITPLALVLIFGGHTLLPLLLSGAKIVGGMTLAAVVIGIVANAFQNTAGSLLMHVGLIREGVAITYVMAALMAALAVAFALRPFTVDVFILAYACAYALGAAAWAAAAWAIIARRHGAALPPASQTALS